MDIVSGAKKISEILQKTYMPTKKQKLIKFATKQAKNENEIKEALKLYQEKTSCTDEQLKEFEKTLREESKKPNKPIFENFDQAMQKLDMAFPSKVNKITDTKKKYEPPNVLKDPFGKPF